MRQGASVLTRGLCGKALNWLSSRKPDVLTPHPSRTPLAPPHAPAPPLRRRTEYILNSWRMRHPRSYASVWRSFWNSVLMRGMPRSHESSRSSSVSRRLVARASSFLRAYSLHTRSLSTNSLSHGWMYLDGGREGWGVQKAAQALEHAGTRDPTRPAGLRQRATGSAANGPPQTEDAAPGSRLASAGAGRACRGWG